MIVRIYVLFGINPAYSPARSMPLHLHSQGFAVAQISLNLMADKTAALGGSALGEEQA